LIDLPLYAVQSDHSGRQIPGGRSASTTIIAGSEVDAYWPPHRLIADLVEAGLRVVRVTWDRRTRGGKREAARFRTLLSPFPGA